MNKINLKNVFSVTLRDTGEVALIDGDTKQIWQHRQDRLRGAHFPPCRFRSLCLRDRPRWSGVLIDLWLEKPTVVAEVKIGLRCPLGRYLQVQGL
jgi:nitrite reductase (NO-forming)/hydroxylamine reductase